MSIILCHIFIFRSFLFISVSVFVPFKFSFSFSSLIRAFHLSLSFSLFLLSIYLSRSYLSLSLFVYLYLHLYLSPSIPLSLYLSVFLYFSLFFCFSVSLSVSFWLSLSLSPLTVLSFCRPHQICGFVESEPCWSTLSHGAGWPQWADPAANVRAHLAARFYTEQCTVHACSTAHGQTRHNGRYIRVHAPYSTSKQPIRVCIVPCSYIFNHLIKTLTAFYILNSVFNIQTLQIRRQFFWQKFWKFFCIIQFWIDRK